MQILRIQTPPTRLPPSSANEDSPSLKASLFPLRLQGFNRVGLCNPLGENQPSLSRRSKLFAMSPVGYGLSPPTGNAPRRPGRAGRSRPEFAWSGYGRYADGSGLRFPFGCPP